MCPLGTEHSYYLRNEHSVVLLTATSRQVVYEADCVILA
jgi:hypothetical protein